ncbi:MAG: ATP synthase F1 subunit delta [Flavobacteriaceae bacterium]
MSNRAAIRYAKAIMDRAQANGLAAQTNDDMLLIADTIKSNAELDSFVKNPVFSTDTRQSALLEVFSGINAESKLLIRLLAENKRLDILDTVALAYNKMFDQISGIEKIQVTTAFPMTPELEAKVIAKAKEFTSNTLVIENFVDETIIGGFILRMGDKQYNASVANKLKTLKRELIN